MKQKTKRILKRAMLVLLCVTVVGGASEVSLLQLTRLKQEVTATSAIGGLNEQDDHQKADKSIYTKTTFDYNALKVNLNLDSTIAH